ncbi:MAG: HAD hydrolase-like protein [Bryobacteraceae bacterium]|nr:HAD hydrolase-like protein [Bryobacteraceae bacterium]
MAARALVLFDIDGTLVRRAGPHHREALIEAVRCVTGFETTTDHIPVQGMLDGDIIAWMLRDAGVSQAAAQRLLPRIVAVAQRHYVRRCPDLTQKVCPGARLALARVVRHGALTGLVTGNLTRIGWKKMERAGLRRYLRFGAFAEMAKDRAGLARMAVARARSEGWIDGRTAVTLIGDHPNDILAARANGIQSIAVATGVVAAEELREYAPDVLLEDLRGLRVGMVMPRNGRE